MATALDRYELHLRKKGNKERSIATTLHRLRSFFPDRDLPVRGLNEARAKRLYSAMCEGAAVDTHRNTLSEARTFLRWTGNQKLIGSNPLARVEAVGKRRKGKEQLRIDEARKWLAVAERRAGGQPGAVAAMVALLMGLRCSEIVSRVVRDLDDDGRLLWIPDSKTEAGKRTVEVPAGLQPHMGRLTDGKEPADRLFGKHWRDWVRKWVQRLCVEAGVPTVSAHGMRGLHATLAEEAGVSAHLVASSLGHVSEKVTHAHYTDPSTVSNAQQRRALKVLAGGRK